jgi:outer membrane protein TolC
MKRWVSALALTIMIAAGQQGLGAETADLSAAREPVRLTLEQCIRMGLERNPEVGVAAAQVDEARSKVDQAKAKKHPTLSASATYVRTNGLPQFKSGDPTAISTSPGGVPSHTHYYYFPGFEMTSDREGDIYSAKIEAQYALYTGGKIENGIAAARLNQDSAQESLRQKKQELVYNITQAFYGALLAQEMVKVVDDAYNTAQTHLQQVKALYNEGLVSNLDLTQTEARVAQITPLQIEAKNGLWMARLGLNNYLNIDLDTPVEAVGSLEYQPHPLPLPEDLYAEALANRAEARVMRIRSEMIKKLYDIARTGGYPTVGLFANYSYSKGSELPPNDQVWRGSYQAGVAVQVPLYDGLETQAKVAEVEAQMRQLAEGKKALELGIRTQVQQAVLSLRSAEEKIKAQDANVAAAAKNHEAVKARYAVGLASNLDVMDAQSALLRAQSDRLTAVHEYNLAWLQLQAALGKLEGGNP